MNTIKRRLLGRHRYNALLQIVQGLILVARTHASILLQSLEVILGPKMDYVDYGAVS